MPQSLQPREARPSTEFASGMPLFPALKVTMSELQARPTKIRTAANLCPDSGAQVQPNLSQRLQGVCLLRVLQKCSMLSSARVEPVKPPEAKPEPRPAAPVPAAPAPAVPQPARPAPAQPAQHLMRTALNIGRHRRVHTTFAVHCTFCPASRVKPWRCTDLSARPSPALPPLFFLLFVGSL